MYGIYANIGGYIDGIHVTIYIAYMDLKMVYQQDFPITKSKQS